MLKILRKRSPRATDIKFYDSQTGDVLSSDPITQILHQSLTNGIRAPVASVGKPSCSAGLAIQTKSAYADSQKIKGLKPTFVGDVAVREASPLGRRLGGFCLCSRDLQSSGARCEITNFQVVSVPESDSVLGILAFGVGSAGLLLKRKRRWITSVRGITGQISYDLF